MATTEDEQPNATANIAHSGTNHDVISNTTWIIDSGNSDHMTNDPKIIKKTLKPLPKIVSQQLMVQYLRSMVKAR